MDERREHRTEAKRQRQRDRECGIPVCRPPSDVSPHPLRIFFDEDFSALLVHFVGEAVIG